MMKLRPTISSRTACITGWASDTGLEITHTLRSTNSSRGTRETLRDVGGSLIRRKGTCRTQTTSYTIRKRSIRSSFADTRFICTITLTGIARGTDATICGGIDRRIRAGEAKSCSPGSLLTSKCTQRYAKWVYTTTWTIMPCEARTRSTGTWCSSFTITPLRAHLGRYCSLRYRGNPFNKSLMRDST